MHCFQALSSCLRPSAGPCQSGRACNNARPNPTGLQQRPAQSHGGTVGTFVAVWVATVLRAVKVCPHSVHRNFVAHWLLPRAFTAVLSKHAGLGIPTSVGWGEARGTGDGATTTGGGGTGDGATSTGGGVGGGAAGVSVCRALRCMASMQATVVATTCQVQTIAMTPTIATTGLPSLAVY